LNFLGCNGFIIFCQDKSYFYAKVEEEINKIIDEVVMSPSYCDLSKSRGRLMIIKDFKENIRGTHYPTRKRDRKL